jgi:hypothetical protein
LKRPRALMLPPGLAWPRAVLDADTASGTRLGRALGAGLLRPAWTGIAIGAPAAGLMRKLMTGLAEPSAIYLAQTDPVPVAQAVAHLASELPGLPVQALLRVAQLMDGQRLVLAPGLGICRADLQGIHGWLETCAALTRPDDLVAFTMPAWKDPAMLEARWGAANPGAIVFADPATRLVTLTGAAVGATATMTHLDAGDVATLLDAHGFGHLNSFGGDSVLGVLARKVSR